jgi:hypothetical protein
MVQPLAAEMNRKPERFKFVETVNPQERLGKLSRFCEPFDWSKGSLNGSTYRAFCKFARYVFNQHSATASSVLQEVARLIERAGDPVKKDKLIDQFSKALTFVSEQHAAESLGASELVKTRSKWPEPELTLIESTAKAFVDCSLEWWESISPAKASGPKDVLSVVFPAGSLVCYGPKQDVHRIRELGEPLCKIACGVQYVVPNPAKAPFIKLERLGGKRSLKCVENFPERRFVVIEFDRTKLEPGHKLSKEKLLDLQAALHAHLEAEYAPLCLLVYSGNESLHGWYPCVGADEKRAAAFLRYACRLGADHSLSAKSFFTRMPGGQHENGAGQTVHYFNPKSL